MTRHLSPLVLTGLAATIGAMLTLAITLLVLDSVMASHLIAPLAVGIALTVAVTALARRRLAEATLRVRFAAVAALATLIGLVNVAVLAWLMIVSEKDALLMAALLVYSTAAAIGAGIATARESAQAVEQIADAAGEIAAGDLSARTGVVTGGPELEALAASIDDMAARLDSALLRERATEARRHDLIVAISHDLRTPLAGLRALTEAIADGVVSDPATIHSYTQKMLDSVGSLSTLIDDLFEFVQLESGAIEAETQRAMLADVVESAVAACGAQAAEKRLALLTTLGDASDAACSPRLTRVVQNLLQNAIRATPPDGTVVVEARHVEGALELAVSDTGAGIDAASVENVFEPFWRGDESRGSEGAGLGLALAKRIVEGLGGRIEVESAPRQGSRFAILLPDAS